jgi:transcriptional regulator with XRE-family HTH domain
VSGFTITRRGEGPNPIDIDVGKKLKALRLLRDMSQNKLAQQVGITFQQLQKYEKGSNRISASKLHQLSVVLGVPITEFFPGGLELLDQKQVGALQEYTEAMEDFSKRTKKLLHVMQGSEGAEQ